MFPRKLLLAMLLITACAKPEPQAQADADPDVARLQGEIAADSMNWQLHAQLADVLRRKNRLEEAAQAAAKAFEKAPSPGIEARLVMAKVYAASEQSASAINLVKDAEKRKREGEAVDEVKIAEVYGVLGDNSAVFRWLERAKTAGSPNLADIETNPDLVAAHEDARWKEMFGS